MAGEFVLNTPVVRAFVADVQAAIADAPAPAAAAEAIRPRFAALLADPDWLPVEYQAAAPTGRLLCPDSADGRHPSRPDDVAGAVGLDPPAHQRHRLRLAPCLRRR